MFKLITRLREQSGSRESQLIGERNTKRSKSIEDGEEECTGWPSRQKEKRREESKGRRRESVAIELLIFHIWIRKYPEAWQDQTEKNLLTRGERFLVSIRPFIGTTDSKLSRESSGEIQCCSNTLTNWGRKIIEITTVEFAYSGDDLWREESVNKQMNGLCTGRYWHQTELYEDLGSFKEKSVNQSAIPSSSAWMVCGLCHLSQACGPCLLWDGVDTAKACLCLSEHTTALQAGRRCGCSHTRLGFASAGM